MGVMALNCPQCGARVASKAALPGHYRRAHRGRFPPRSGRVRAEVLDVIPIRSEIVRYARESAPTMPVRGETRIVPAKPKSRPAEIIPSGDGPPSWWEPQADPGWRHTAWAGFSADYRNRLLARRAGAAFTIRPPEATDAVILWSQFHALKALATRLDAGIGTEREHVAFEAGLREYNANFDRIAQRKALPG